MLELPHVLVAATIATKIPNPIISLPLALASHILIDFVPHWNPSLYTETKKYGQPTKKSTTIVILDTLAALIVGLWVASRVFPDFGHALMIVWACFFAVLPDVIEAPYFYLNFKPKILERLILWQHDHQGRATKIPGLLTQLVAVIASLAIIFS